MRRRIRKRSVSAVALGGALRKAGLAAGVVAWTLLAAAEVADAAPQPYTSSGAELGSDYVLETLERILPADWAIAENLENTTPYMWEGEETALAVKLEDRSLQLHHPRGFTYHPFIRLYFCPPDWAGTMQEADYLGTREPAFLLGTNHIFGVYYQARGLIRWHDAWDKLAATFDLTRPFVQREVRGHVDRRLWTRLAQRISTVGDELLDDVMERINGLDRQGNLLYIEYVAAVSSPPPAPGAPALPPTIRELVEKETAELTDHVFQTFPEVSTIYVRRLCDNRLFDRVFQRQAPTSQLAPAEGSVPARAAVGSGAVSPNGS